MSVFLPHYGQSVTSLPQYKFGDKLKSFVKENKQGVFGGLKTLAGGVLVATGVGAGVGTALIASGVKDIGQEIKGDREEKAARQQQDLQEAQEEVQQNDYLQQLQTLQDEKIAAQESLFEQEQEAFKERETARQLEQEQRETELATEGVRASTINERIQGQTAGTAPQFSFKGGGCLTRNYALGGPIINDYQDGQLHSGPNGGIPVDENGTPIVMNKTRPVGLTENGEITYNGYVFSDSIPYKSLKRNA